MASAVAIISMPASNSDFISILFCFAACHANPRGRESDAVKFTGRGGFDADGMNIETRLKKCSYDVYHQPHQSIKAKGLYQVMKSVYFRKRGENDLFIKAIIPQISIIIECFMKI